MRMDVYNETGVRVATIDVDPASPPTVVRGPGASGASEEHYLDWDRTFDDEGQLRKCPVCHCDDLFRRRPVPPLTGFIVVLAVGLICLALWGLTSAPLGWMLAVLVAVVIVNVAIVSVTPAYLQCYRCGSRFRQIKISRNRQEWDATTAERYRDETPPPRPSAPDGDQSI